MQPDWVVSFVISVLVPFIYVFVFVRKQGNNSFASEDTRKMYFSAIQSLLTAAGIAVAITGGRRGIAFPSEPMLRHATFSLSLCVLFALASLLEMARLYEKCRLQSQKKNEVVPLTNVEFHEILILDYLALATFLWGLAYFARLTMS